MSDFKVEDRVYLECEVAGKDTSDNTYQIKYKNWCGEEKITYHVANDVLHTTDESYNKGLNDAWELAKKIVLPDHLGGYTVDELKDIFGKGSFAPLMDTLTAQEALAKVKAYEEECNKIKVGDIVTVRGSILESIVTKVDGHVVYRLFRDGSSDSYVTKEDLDIIGHYISIDEFMRSADD